MRTIYLITISQTGPEISRFENLPEKKIKKILVQFCQERGVFCVKSVNFGPWLGSARTGTQDFTIVP